MFIANAAIRGLVGATPLLVFFESTFLDGLVELWSAAILAAVAFSIRPGEAGHLLRTLRWASLLAVLPLLWLIIQLVPFPAPGLASSLWQSVNSALGHVSWISISIDPSNTWLMIVRYTAMVNLMCAACAISTDRRQAEILFFLVCGALVFLSSISVVLNLTGLSPGTHAASTAASSYGSTLTVALAILIVERHLTRRASQDFRWNFLLPLMFSLGGFVICMVASIGHPYTLFAGFCGFAAVAIIQCIRRIGLDWRAGMALAVVAVGGTAIGVAANSGSMVLDFSMRYAARATEEEVGICDLIIKQAGWTGTGSGTFTAIYSLFAPAGAHAVVAPTTAAQIIIELGLPGLWFSGACMTVMIFLCGRGGFLRGRDFFYPSAGAGVGIATFVLAFCDVGLNNLAIEILLASTTGLALAQSVSRKL